MLNCSSTLKILNIRLFPGTIIIGSHKAKFSGQKFAMGGELERLGRAIISDYWINIWAAAGDTRPELSFIKCILLCPFLHYCAIFCLPHNIIAGIINQSVCLMWAVIHYFSRCKLNDDLMQRRIKDCRHEEPEYLTRRWRFISSESENDFRKVLQICTEERIETLVSRSGWLWQQPQLFKKVIKSESRLSDWLATELQSFNLLMHIYYEEPIGLFRPGHWCIGTYYLVKVIDLGCWLT